MGETTKNSDERQRRLVSAWTAAVPVVTSFIRSAVPNFHDAEDILQQVAEVVLERFNEFDDSKPFVPWAVGIARLKILENHRKKARCPQMLSSETLKKIAAAYQDQSSLFGPMRDALDLCIEKLHPRGRRLLEMRYREDKKPTVIAEDTGETANNIRVALHRLRNILAKCITQTLANRSTP